MTTPEQLESLAGQQYLVLRPSGSVGATYEAFQSAVLAGLDETVTHPHTGHVTLRGFYEPERRDELTGLIREWAAAQRPIDIVAEAVDAFPAPWQILIVRLARTASLVSAYASLTAALAGTDFRRLGELSLEDWTFHLSVVYGRSLTPEKWSALAARMLRELPEHPTELIADIELVWYEGGVEHAEVIPLGIRR